MAITFSRGTKLILVSGGTRYEILVSSATAGQTFIEGTRVTRTIHAPDLIDNSYVNEKGTADLKFSCHLGRGPVEGAILKWFDMVDLHPKYELLSNYLEPTAIDVYIDAGSSVYKVSSCVGRGISFKLSRKEILTIEVDAVGADLEEVPSVPTIGNLETQDVDTFNTNPLDIAGFSNVVGVTCELTREVRFLNRKGIHDIGSLYKVSKPRISNLALSGKITRNKLTPENEYNPLTEISISKGPFSIVMPSCNTTDRWEMGDIHTTITDYKVIGNGSYIII